MGWFDSWGKYALLGPAGFAIPGKKKDSGGGFEYQPYEGPRPEQPKYLRETEDMYKNLIFPRAQGIGVGYDPQRTELLKGLVKSELGMAEEDALRDAKGALSSSGLSGNPRAYEALAGRVKRDSSRSLGNELSRIAISDLERQNQERDVNTARVGDFNNFNFGQSNKVADFGLDVYNSEQGNRLSAAGFNQGVQQNNQARKDQLYSDLGGLAVSGASLAMGNPAPMIMYGVGQTANQQGKGIAPNYSSLSTPSYYRQGMGSYRNYVR